MNKPLLEVKDLKIYYPAEAVSLSRKRTMLKLLMGLALKFIRVKLSA